MIPSVFPWNGPDAAHFGLARCVKCREVISNRDPNPCPGCKLRAQLASRQPKLETLPPHPEYVAVVDEAPVWDWGPERHYSVWHDVMVAVRRWWRKGEK